MPIFMQLIFSCIQLKFYTYDSCIFQLLFDYCILPIIHCPKYHKVDFWPSSIFHDPYSIVHCSWLYRSSRNCYCILLKNYVVKLLKLSLKWYACCNCVAG
ncbi:hypothetical protein VIGAN_11052700 [Vigna angularis var. angularis]|uniref:Uncharacterized protein n=1 Tax=Vigna angularis var. angularis TaxID=157739 RepID=A0A0S3T8H3_PHAAN|nr:hypothetical protein VIGAN_11052700 [Vigna angularis var. angularis]